ncbi:uncharacterized protein C8Q71DRAFT_707100, partial [Rhodofomes roseus]
MLTTAKKHNVSFAAIKLSASLKEELPVWYHLGATKKLRQLNNTKVSDCLRDNHDVRLVADLMPLAKRECYSIARAVSNDFVPTDCACPNCETDSGRGCKHPMNCCKAAAYLLAQVHPKWHPDIESPKDGLTLTRRRKDKNEQALEEAEGDVVFDPSLTSRGHIAEAFRVFVDPRVHDEPPAIRAKRGRIVEDEAVTAYIVESVAQVHLPRGTDPMPLDHGFVFYPDSGRGELVWPGHNAQTMSHPMGAAVAALKIVSDTPRDAPLRI